MWIVLFDPLTARELGRTWRLSPPDPATLERIKATDFAAPGALVWTSESEPGDAPLLASLDQGAVASVAPDPDWQPAPPPADPVQALLGEVARLEYAVARNVAASPHDRRFLTQKEIGKQLIRWLKGHPDATPQDAEDLIMGLVLTELPGQPVVPKLYWEWIDPVSGQVLPQGLAMSYCYEAVVRGYLPPEAPVTWQTLVQLVVSTPEEQIAAWLRSL